jgi:hypothetical protein
VKKAQNTKRAGGMAQGVGPELKPQYHKKTKRGTTWNLYIALSFLGNVLAA